MKQRIGVLVGSVRNGSYSRSIANVLVKFLPGFDVSMVETGDLPLFNQDYDDKGNVPPQWTRFREEIGDMDGFLFVTPEYNRSVPPVMKNALDIASRPYGKNMWDGKPGLVVGVSPGTLGAFGAVQHLRQTMAFLNINLMRQPEVFISRASDLLDGDGKLTNEGTEGFLKSVAEKFAAFVKENG